MNTRHRPFRGISLGLNISCSLDAFANGFAGFAQPVSAEFFIIYTRNLNVNVDAVKQWTGDALLIFGHHGWGAGAGFLGVSIESARAGMYAIEQVLECVKSV